MSFKVTDTVTWVGQTRLGIATHFHGEEYSTHRGSTYNCLPRAGREDSTWWKRSGPPSQASSSNSSRPWWTSERIDYIIANHAESDHSGGLPELMRRIPDVPVFCTANGVKSLKGHYHQDWNFKVVKTGQRLSLGKPRTALHRSADATLAGHHVLLSDRR